MRPIALLLLVPAVAVGQGTAADYERAKSLRERYADTVYRDAVEPNWTADGNTFWYRVALPDRKREFVLVDAVAGTRKVVPEADLPKTEPPPRTNPREFGSRNADSPDGKWAAFLKDQNVWLRDRKSKDESPLSKDGTEADGYTQGFYWSPDSTRLVVIRRTRGGDRRVTLVESSPRNQVQPRVQTNLYLKPGDDVPQPRPRLFDIPNRKEIPLNDGLFPNPWDCTQVRWQADGKRFSFVYNQRGHGVVRVVAVDAATGEATALVDEQPKTFFDYNHKTFLRHLGDDELIWMSERSGWNHLYLIDVVAGKVKNPITTGEWVVRGVEFVDTNKREITVRVMGLNRGEDPYHMHYAKVNFDGTGFTKLTAGDGTHTVKFSPDRRFLVDTWSRVDAPPVTVLRKADGSKVCDLETADTAKLTATGWKPPERFVTKGRDGTTDIYGLIYRPSTFDPAKKYRVIEHIYAGPQDFFVPKGFRTSHSPQRMAELGFVVVQMDGMGTNWRSKAFHDVCWKNLGDSGFPDRIAWIKAAAAKCPEMDISKGVGIYGGSAGGQSTVRGMTEYPDFYVVGVADCGCHDNRMDKVWWNELWMSWPVGPHYKAQSNVTNAHKITGKLLLVVGELDTNVDPSSTMQVANALVKADRDFDLLIVPGAGHGAAETPYGNRRRADFLVRNLLGVEPRGK